MVAVSDFSGLVSSACALARAPEMLPILSLERCMAEALPAQEIKAHRARFRSFGPDPMSDRLFSVLWHESFELRFRFLVLEVSVSSTAEDAGEFGPGIGRAHVDDPHRINAGPRRIDAEEARGLA